MNTAIKRSLVIIFTLFVLVNGISSLAQEPGRDQESKTRETWRQQQEQERDKRRSEQEQSSGESQQPGSPEDWRRRPGRQPAVPRREDKPASQPSAPAPSEGERPAPRIPRTTDIPTYGRDRFKSERKPGAKPSPSPPPDKPRTVVHRHDHHPHYWDSHRHRYDYAYYYWYYNYFLSPIYWPYYRIGYVIPVLPSNSVRVMVGSNIYYFYAGVFYQPRGADYVAVKAPTGAILKGLPAGVVAFSLGLTTYYMLNDVYYLWNPDEEGYVVVEKPQGADEAIKAATHDRLVAKPIKGQDAEQQARDRYECHRWAVSQSGIDPTLEDVDYPEVKNQEYKRAIAACLEARDYEIK